MILRDYQVHARDALWSYFHDHKKGNPLVLMPTGTGKSLVIADFCRQALFEYPATRILMLTHVETLIEQNAEKLRAIWPTCPLGIYSAGLDQRNTHQQIIYGSIQSLYKMGDFIAPPHLIIVDEAHLIGPNDETMYQTFFDVIRKRHPEVKIVGFTATDWRMGSGRLTHGNIFTDIAVNMTTPAAWDWFIDNGYLATLNAKKTTLRLSEEGIGHAHGEFILGQQQKALNKEQITEAAIHEMNEKAFDRNCWLIFATGTAHCDNVAGMLNEFGIDAVSIHSKTKNAADRLKEFKNGEYRAAVSMNKLTTGVDIPQVDHLGILRFTDSSGNWVQMLGRGTRPLYAPGFDLSIAQERLAAMQASAKPNGCLVTDFAHNTERLGPINNPLVREPKKGRKSTGQLVVRVCPECKDYVHASKQFCTCGYEFTMVIKIQTTASEAEVMTRATQEEPVVEKIEVAHVTYRSFKRRNSEKPPILKVTYYAIGLLRRFEEYICFEHSTYKARAHNWWLERSPDPVPATCADAESQASRLRVPRSIKVWTNIPKPKVMSYEF